MSRNDLRKPNVKAKLSKHKQKDKNEDASVGISNKEDCGESSDVGDQDESNKDAGKLTKGADRAERLYQRLLSSKDNLIDNLKKDLFKAKELIEGLKDKQAIFDQLDLRAPVPADASTKKGKTAKKKNL